MKARQPTYRQIKILIGLFTVFFGWQLFAQSLQWTNISDQYTLPEGVEIFQGTQQNPALKAWYLDANLNNPDIDVRPYIKNSPTGVAPFVHQVGAIAGVNGGFFNTSTGESYSSVVYPGEVKAQNIAVLTRDSQQYPVTRAFFGVDTARDVSIDWIYHFGSEVTDVYRFPQPAQNAEGSPAPLPQMSDGEMYTALLAGIGGGPVLIKGGALNITFTEEVFWGSGVGYDVRNPRTATGITADNHVILLVVDGRQDASVGATIPELANIMLDLNCVQAMNLDGGGSSQMAIDNQLINTPEGGTYMRPVPTIWTIVHADSLPDIPTEPEPLDESILDTEDSTTTVIGGWNASANQGYWGGTPALYNQIGEGDDQVIFHPNLQYNANYEVYAWWVAANNRCQDTPVVVKHQNGADTVRVDQTTNGAQWNYIGTYRFRSDSSDAVIVSDAGTVGSYVIADGIKIVTYDTTTTRIQDTPDRLPVNFTLKQNYPNPFNASTRIEYHLSSDARTALTLYNMKGESVANYDLGHQESGNHSLRITESGLPSGMYFYRLTAGNFSQMKKMILLK